MSYKGTMNMEFIERLVLLCDHDDDESKESFMKRFLCLNIDSGG